jgi:cytidylate kinase
VVEGRDIGTVVLPEAELKIYLSASPEERARRRAIQRGKEAELERVKEAITLRDRQDSERETAPLKPAPDAFVIDTTRMGFEEVVERILGLAEGLRGEA